MTAVWWGNCLGCGRGPRTIYQYLAVEQTLFSCELGRYTAFGIAAQKRVPDGWRQIAFVPDNLHQCPTGTAPGAAVHTGAAGTHPFDGCN